MNGDITIIPQNSEEYISFSKVVDNSTPWFINNSEKIKLKFIDSLRFAFCPNRWLNWHRGCQRVKNAFYTPNVRKIIRRSKLQCWKEKEFFHTIILMILIDWAKQHYHHKINLKMIQRVFLLRMRTTNSRAVCGKNFNWRHSANILSCTWKPMYCCWPMSSGIFGIRVITFISLIRYTTIHHPDSRLTQCWSGPASLLS